jgi:alpha-1,3-fucosyltransferase
MTSMDNITHMKSYFITKYKKCGFYNITLIILSLFSIIYFTFLMFNSTFNNERGAFIDFIETEKNNEFNLNNSAQFQFDGYPKTDYLYQRKSINFDNLAPMDGKKTKKILYWNRFFGNVDFAYGLGDKVLETNKCPITKCEFINDRRRLNESDLVLVHMRDPINQIPSYRSMNQRWVFVLYESSMNTDSFEEYNGVFNLTSTYRIDSDFPGFYFENGFKWAFNPRFNENYNFHANKRHNKFAAALISNTNDKSQRKEYINDLKKYIQVDIYGKYGKDCSKLGPNTDCRREISKNYKFFLAFENSICKDYITEKFFRTLHYDIIPVVLGGGPYDFYVITILYF